MQSLRDAVKSVNFTQGYDYVAIYSLDYIAWASNKVKSFLEFFQISINRLVNVCNRLIGFTDHWRRINQELEFRNNGGRNSNAGATQESTRIILGDVLRAIHAR